MIFLTLVILKHAVHWDFLTMIFCLNRLAFERAVMSFIEIITVKHYEQCVAKFEGGLTMLTLAKKGIQFSHQRFSLYATDFTCQ